MWLFWVLFILTIILIIFVFILVYQLGRRHFFSRIFGRSIKTDLYQRIEVREWFNRTENLHGVFSVSLYKNCSVNLDIWRERYYDPLLKSIQSVQQTLPGWQYRVYLDPSLEQTYRDELINKGAQVGIMKYGNFDNSGSVWRFLSAADSPNFLCVDADDNPFQTFQIDQINKWLESSHRFILVPLYLVNLLVPISAGSWGGRAHSIPDIAERLSRYNHGWFGADEAFLTREIWPLVKQLGYYRTNQRGAVYLLLFGLSLALILLISLSVYCWSKQRGSRNILMRKIK